jgi:DNA-binding transcriptional LysR family regulator
MEFRDLNYLIELSKTGHVGRAAGRLGLTQPALTKCIARLEADLRVPLLERTGRGVALTPYGRHLVRHAERLRAADTDIRRELMELATGNAGHIRIGTGFVLSQHLLPTACVALLKQYPSITLDIVTGNSESLFPALREGRIDVVLAGIIGDPVPGIRQVFLMEDQVLPISRKDHPLQRKRTVDARTASRARWAMPAVGTLPALWLDQKWRDLGVTPPECAVRSGSLPTLLRIVAETDLLMFQSWGTVKRNNNYGKLLRPLRCNDLTWKHGIGATVRDNGYVSPAIDRLIEALRAAAASEASLRT